MKKLLLLGAIAAGLLATSSQARAGISFSISLGHDHHHYRPRVVVAPPPVVVAPPVVAYGGHCAPPVVAYPGYYAPASRYVYGGGHHRHYDYRGHDRHYGHGTHGLHFQSPRGGYAVHAPHRY
jgi:hypothetical protein